MDVTSTAASAHPISEGFEWQAEDEAMLELIASTDAVSSDWARLRDVIKYKLNQNINIFLTEHAQSTNGASPFSPRPQTPGGLKLAPFPPRERDESNTVEAPKAILSATEAEEMKGYIYTQLHEFDSAPFTVQRVCELCVHPKQHYKYIGKYLRAFEKALLVTSTWDTFPALPESSTNTNQNGTTASEPSFFPSRSPSVPSTPLFSPIPFLHDDARRSKSRSPPPFMLDANAADVSGEPPLLTQSENHGLEPKALGLVDELDDPSPGHLSEHPTALTSVTTVNADNGARSLFGGTLEERFVPSANATEELVGNIVEERETAAAVQDWDAMELDTEDKENKG